jgi:hypothetical protein
MPADPLVLLGSQVFGTFGEFVRILPQVGHVEG